MYLFLIIKRIYNNIEPKIGIQAIKDAIPIKLNAKIKRPISIYLIENKKANPIGAKICTTVAEGSLQKLFTLVTFIPKNSKPSPEVKLKYSTHDFAYIVIEPIVESYILKLTSLISPSSIIKEKYATKPNIDNINVHQIIIFEIKYIYFISTNNKYKTNINIKND
jgi:hypothetical protein